VQDVSRQREMGLYAMFIVEEKNPPAGIVRQLLLLDDWKLTEDGTIEDDFGDLEEAVGQGRLGNWFTVNGSFRPRIDAPRGKLLRLRLLNAANVRTMGLQFKGSTPWVAALDGQPIAPRRLGTSAFMLAPGQRADLLIEGGEDDVTVALDLFEDLVEIAYLIRSGESGKAALPDGYMLPDNPVASFAGQSHARHVPLIIEGGAKGGLKSALYQGEKLESHSLLDKGMAWALNGTAGIPVQPWEIFRKDDEIVFDIDNRTAFAQPLHIQGHVWREIGPGWHANCGSAVARYGSGGTKIAGMVCPETGQSGRLGFAFHRRRADRFGADHHLPGDVMDRIARNPAPRIALIWPTGSITALCRGFSRLSKECAA
jgi:FtsP/CotA-like multicopper oxidase with cupredoxin domain